MKISAKQGLINMLLVCWTRERSQWIGKVMGV